MDAYIIFAKRHRFVQDVTAFPWQDKGVPASAPRSEAKGDLSCRRRRNWSQNKLLGGKVGKQLAASLLPREVDKYCEVFEAR